MTPRLIAFAGRISAGKSFAAKHLVREHGFTLLSFADPLREMLLKLDPVVGWDIENDCAVHLSDALLKHGDSWNLLKKTVYADEVRRLMQMLGSDVVRHIDKDYWVKRMIARLSVQFDFASQTAVIDDVRFQNELHMVKSLGGTVVFIDRPDHPSRDEHESEQFKIEWADQVIVNDGGPEFLKTVEELLT